MIFLYTERVLKSINSYLKERYGAQDVLIVDFAAGGVQISPWGDEALRTILTDRVLTKREFELISHAGTSLHVFFYYSLQKLVILKDVADTSVQPERMFAAIEFIMYKILYVASQAEVRELIQKIDALQQEKSTAKSVNYGVSAERSAHLHAEELDRKLKEMSARYEKSLQEITSLSAIIQITKEENVTYKNSLDSLHAQLHENTSLLKEKESALIEIHNAFDVLKKEHTDMDSLLKRVSEGRRKLVKIYDALDDPILTLKADYSVESVNNSGALLQGIEPVDVIKKEMRCYQLLGYNEPCPFCFLSLVKEDRKQLSRTIECEIQGKKKIFILNMIPIVVNDSLDVVIEYFRDITDMMTTLEAKTQLETKLKDEIDEKERIRVTVDWTQVDRVKQLTQLVGMLKNQQKFYENKIKRLEVIIENLKQHKAVEASRTTMLFEITKVINLLQNLVDGKKITLNHLQERKMDEAISLIKDYSVFLQTDVTRLEGENTMLRKQVEEYEAILKPKDEQKDAAETTEEHNG